MRCAVVIEGEQCNGSGSVLVSSDGHLFMVCDECADDFVKGRRDVRHP